MPSSFSIMTMNLRFGLADDGPNRWEIRKTTYPTLFADTHPEIVCFQEANDFQLTFLAGLLPDYRFIGCRGNAPERWQHNPIFHHQSIRMLKSRHFFLSPTPDIESQFPGSKWPRQGASGLFEKNGQKFMVINTHFDFDAEVQEQSADLMLELMREAGDAMPVILTGDLNAGPDSSALERLTSEGGFQNPSGSGFPGTFHGFTGTAIGDQIDWILGNRNVKVLEVKRVEASFQGKYPSDHFPVIARVRITG